MMLRACCTLLLVCLHSVCQAQLSYEFIDAEESTVLATLELSALPAGIDEFLTLRFTDAGEDLFGLGSVYAGTFDHMTHHRSEFQEDRFSPGGLAGRDAFGSEFATMIDDDPPLSAAFPGPHEQFSLFASPWEQLDHIRLLNEDDTEIYRVGDWQLVPEPHPSTLTFILFLLGVRQCVLLRLALPARPQR